MGALNRADGRIDGDGRLDFVLVRHEEMAAFMGCAHAKYMRRDWRLPRDVGPRRDYLLNGLYDAKLDHQPVLAIVDQQALSALGGDYQQEVDLVSLFKDTPTRTCTWRPTPRRSDISSIAR